MTSINTQVIATRLRVAKNFMLLINAGLESSVAAEIVKQHKHLSFNEVRFSDDKVVVCYKTCTSQHRVEFAIAA